MNEKRNEILIYLLIGIIGSAVFAFAGYLCGGAIGIGMEQGIGFIDGLIVVLENPFSKYFNNYTPITILLGFVLFETGCAIYLFNRKQDEKLDEEEYQPDIIDLVEISDKDRTDNLELADKDLFGLSTKRADDKTIDSMNDHGKKETFVDSCNKRGADKTDMSNSPTEDVKELDEKLSFGSEIMDEMLGAHYTLDQMVAMINIKKYMKDVNAELLMRMFSSDMSPEDIASYISLFYE